MRYLYKLYHPNKSFLFKLPLEETENSIHTIYYLADEKAYHRVKERQVPLSQLSWFKEKDFDDPQEEEMYRHMTDDEYFMNQVTSKATHLVQELCSKWFQLIKSSKKTIEVHLFASSPLSGENEISFGNSHQENLRIFLPAALIEKKLDASHYRTHIPSQLSLQPAFDLFFGLDFQMVDWRYLISHEFPNKLSELWMLAFWSLRNQSLAYFPALKSGEGLEMNSNKIRQYVDMILNRIIAAGENGDLDWGFIKRMRYRLYKKAPNFGSTMMLHALQVHEQLHPNQELKRAIRVLSGTSTYFDDKDIATAFRYARKMDFDRFIAYLTMPSPSEKALIDASTFRKVNRMLLKLDKSGSLFKGMLDDKTEYLFHISLEGKKRKDSYISLEGVRLHLDMSAMARFQLICEEWS
jgi:hypothetical protein